MTISRWRDGSKAMMRGSEGFTAVRSDAIVEGVVRGRRK